MAFSWSGLPCLRTATCTRRPSAIPTCRISDNFAVEFRYPLSYYAGSAASPHVVGASPPARAQVGRVHGYSFAARRLLLAERLEYRDRSATASHGAVRATQTNENELLVTGGVRYDFYADSDTCLILSGSAGAVNIIFRGCRSLIEGRPHLKPMRRLSLYCWPASLNDFTNSSTLAWPCVHSTKPRP